MQPLGKEWSISCFQEPLTFVRVNVKRTERNSEKQVSCYRMALSITNPRIIGIHLIAATWKSPHQRTAFKEGARDRTQQLLLLGTAKRHPDSPRIRRQGSDNPKETTFEPG